MRKQKWFKGRKKRGSYHTRNNLKNYKEMRNKLSFAQGRPKLKLSREEFS